MVGFVYKQCQIGFFCIVKMAGLMEFERPLKFFSNTVWHGVRSCLKIYYKQMNYFTLFFEAASPANFVMLLAKEKIRWEHN